jgi:hypothetical protein
MDNSCWDEYTDNYSDDEHVAPKSFEDLKKEKLLKKYLEYSEDLLLVTLGLIFRKEMSRKS